MAAFIVPGFELAEQIIALLKARAAAKKATPADAQATAKIVQAGNTAIEGATIALLSKRKLQELEAMVKKVQHCRLETHPSFFDFFVEGCQFKPVGLIPCAK